MSNEVDGEDGSKNEGRRNNVYATANLERIVPYKFTERSYKGPRVRSTAVPRPPHFIARMVSNIGCISLSRRKKGLLRLRNSYNF